MHNSQVHKLLVRHAPPFAGQQPGGEFGLACTQAHAAFNEIYEAKVDSELAAHGTTRERLAAFLEKGMEENEGPHYLLDMLLGLDDFQHFVDLVIRRRDGKRVMLPVNLRDAQDITDLVFGCEVNGDDDVLENRTLTRNDTSS